MSTNRPNRLKQSGRVFPRRVGVLYCFVLPRLSTPPTTPFQQLPEGDELKEIASKMATGQVLVLDLQNVEYISSAMVGQLVQLRNATAKNGVEMRLRKVSSTIQGILQVMHLDKVFRIETLDA